MHQPTAPSSVSRSDDAGAWGPIWGYARAVRAGDRIIVSGTTGSTPDGAAVPGGTGAQAEHAIGRIRRAIEELTGEGERAVVVRTRTYMLDPSEWEAVAPHHRAAFGDEPPAATLIATPGLIGDELTVEIEAEAVVLRA